MISANSLPIPDFCRISVDQPVLDRSGCFRGCPGLDRRTELPLDDPDFRVTVGQTRLVRGQIEMPRRERLQNGPRLVERRQRPLRSPSAPFCLPIARWQSASAALKLMILGFGRGERFPDGLRRVKRLDRLDDASRSPE